MNSYAHHLAPAAEEIRASAASEEGGKWDSQWDRQIEDLTEKTRAAQTDEGAERYLDILLCCIVVSGPLGKGFAPSIDVAAGAMQRKRKRQFKARRLAKEKHETGGEPAHYRQTPGLRHFVSDCNRWVIECILNSEAPC